MQTYKIPNLQKVCVPKVHLLGHCVKHKNVYFHRNNIIIDDQVPSLAHHSLFIYVVENTSATEITVPENPSFGNKQYFNCIEG